jgi:hypothetical protein
MTRLRLNYKQIIKNEFQNAELNMLNNPFNGRLHNRFFMIAKIYRQVNKRHIGCDSITAKNFYYEMIENPRY